MVTNATTSAKGAGSYNYVDFIEHPQAYFLSSLPSLLQATKVHVIKIISEHSPNKEYPPAQVTLRSLKHSTDS